jgi:rod shape determining protein RodA
VKRLTTPAFDVLLFSAVITLTLIGILFIYSSGVNAAGAVVSREYVKQLVWAVTGVGLLLTFAFLNYTALRTFSLYIYLGNILLLLLTLAVGREVNGAHSWIGVWEFGIQPSEFAKLSTILFLAMYFTGIGNGVRELPRFLLGLVIVLIPVFLTILQPDMGTALVFFPIFLLMAFIAGAQLKHLVFILVTGILTITFASLPTVTQRAAAGGARLLGLISDTDFLRYFLLAMLVITILSFFGYRSLKQRYFYWILYSSSALLMSLAFSLALRLVLKDYQIMRMIIFMNPHLDPQGAGWNILQSVTAIGSGGFWGKGFLQGTQSHYRFLPQQSTDFIFSIIAEEWGFMGGILIFVLFLVILLRGISIIWSSRDDFAVLVGSGILSMLFFHMIVNAGMAMGIMPVTGIPLPLLSYGGSSLWTAMCGIGILMNISRRRLHY